MSDEPKQPLTLAEILDRRIAENQKGLAIARERVTAFRKAAVAIEGALIELRTLRREIGGPPAAKPEPSAPAPQ